MKDKPTVSDELLQRCERALWRTMPSILHANRQVSQEEITDDLQLTPAQFHILRNIHRGEKSISDIAACEKVSLPAISRQVDGLVNMGLVERTRDAADRRSIILALTENGHTAWNKLMERKHLHFSERLKSLNPAEIETIIEGLDLLYRAFANEDTQNYCEAHGGKQHHA
jgi:DNA-binding MarR family transcriptional regulator